MAKVLVVGGAGYVGSAACAHLTDQGHDVWVLDDLSTGHRSLALGRGFTLAQAGDRAALRRLLARERFDCAMHFAAKSLVGESVQKPKEYFENNVEQTQVLLEELLAHGVHRFVFSSTCAIFGDPGDQRISESLPKKPINPYGETKLAAEKIMEELARTRGLQATVLRYFNAAGADAKLRAGEWHEPETHLIPNVLKAALSGKPVRVFGGDYPTKDGTCVRDYVHVTDLARAHEAAMNRMLALPMGQGRFEAFNLGSESGYTVREIVQACERVTGIPLKVEIEPRRPGDPPRLVADSRLARQELGFKVSEGSLERIIESAWAWEQKRRAPAKAVFLDRDGTLNVDPGYLNDPEQVKLLPGVPEALALLKSRGYRLVVISNQSGVARGLVERTSLPKIHSRMDELLSERGGYIDHFELCFHHPSECCECRKPKPKMILDAAARLAIDVSKSFMVGDRESDLEAGRNARCKGVALVRTGEGRDAEGGLKPGAADFSADSLLEVARWILDQETASS